MGLVPRESPPVIINSLLLLTKKLHLVCGRVHGLDVGLHLSFDSLQLDIGQQEIDRKQEIPYI